MRVDTHRDILFFADTNEGRSGLLNQFNGGMNAINKE